MFRVVPVLLSAILLAQPVEDPQALAEEARALMEEERAFEAMQRLEVALEYLPEDAALLELAANACVDLDRRDEAYWYATLALDHGEGSKAAVARLNGILGELSPVEAKPDELLEDYAENLFKLAQTCQRKKLYANAVEFLTRCRGTRFEERADAQLDKLFSNQKAIEALLATGVDIPAKPVTKKSPEWIAREDRKHADWEDAYEIKGKYYTIITNMGYEMAQSMSLAMEQMNLFYRQIFHYKQRGGTMRRCVIKVYATREEFEEHEGEREKGVKGFFVPLENRVATYDPRSEGRPLSSLWSTLFHEASHQFTRAVSTDLIPAWLNEGTASYFEGALLLPSGFVETNRIPDERLGSLLYFLDEGRPSVKTVVSYFQPGSYPGEYYPFGWGLAYFIHNYENEKSERVYVPIYQDYLKTYKSGGKHDPFERFVEYFVERVEQPGVETFDDFVRVWKSWIRDLGELHFGDEEQAVALLARADRQRENGQLAYAAESYRWALTKRDETRTHFELAECLAELERDDAAMQSYRKVLQRARRHEDPGGPLPGFDGRTTDEVAADCLAAIRKINRNVAEGIEASDDKFATKVVEAAQGFREAGFPRSSVQLLDTSASVLGGSGALRMLQREIQSEDDVDARRWRRLSVGDELELWQGNDHWSAADGAIRFEVDGVLSSLIYREDLPEAFRYEARVIQSDAGDFPVFGLVFGANNQTGQRMFTVFPETGAVALAAFKEGPEILEGLTQIPALADGLRMAIEVRPGAVEFFLEGESVKELELPEREIQGRIGLFAQSVGATFTDLRVRY